MDRLTQTVIDNIKFLQKANKDKRVKIDDLWEMCKENHISSMTLNRIILELEKAETVIFVRSGIFVFIDPTEVMSSDSPPS